MDIKKIPSEILGAVRQNLGADNEKDEQCDKEIEGMSPLEIMRRWSAWHIGDPTWASLIIEGYETLKMIQEEGGE